MAKKKKADIHLTACGALSPTGPGAKIAKGGGGKITYVNHGKKEKTPEERIFGYVIWAMGNEN